MVTLALPALATNEEQTRYVVSLLEKHVRGFGRGIQLLLFSNVLDNAVLEEEVVRVSTTVVPGSFRKIFHAPIAPHHYDSRLNLSCEESVEVYVHLARLVARCGGEAMIIHTNCTYEPDQWESVTRAHIYDRMLQKVYGHLKAIIAQSPVPILLENLPTPLKGDVTSDSATLVFDPFLGTVEQIREFYDGAVCGLQFCFDTSHYGILRRQVNNLAMKYGSGITSHDVNKEGLKVFCEDVVMQPGLEGLYAQLRVLMGKKMTCVQLADYKGEWRAAHGNDKGSIFEEGSIVGGGDFGEELLSFTVAYARDYPTGIISVDVGVEDFLKRDEQIVSLQRVVEALKKAGVKEE